MYYSKKKSSDSTTKSSSKIKHETCIICQAQTENGHPQCYDCWSEMIEFKDNFNKDTTLGNLKGYYFNLQSNIYRIKRFDYVQQNCNKLMALAVLTKTIYKDESLTDRVISDINKIIEKKNPQSNQEKNLELNNISENTETQDYHLDNICRTIDGHMVKSDSEVTIDDILYELRVPHCYEKKVNRIPSSEPAVQADWFIPVTSISKGIYIEYWGMKKKDYLANKDRKLQQYKKYDIPLIQIEKDDVRERQTLIDRLETEIPELAEKYYGVKNFLR